MLKVIAKKGILTFKWIPYSKLDKRNKKRAAGPSK
jgi:hypothetical protein